MRGRVLEDIPKLRIDLACAENGSSDLDRRVLVAAGRSPFFSTIRPTVSVDDACALVPEGMIWAVCNRSLAPHEGEGGGAGPRAMARVAPVAAAADEFPPQTAATPALALSAALVGMLAMLPAAEAAVPAAMPRHSRNGGPAGWRDRAGER